MEINRNCPATPSFNELKPPIFTPREQSFSNKQDESSVETNRNIYALNLTHITDIQSPINDISLNEQFHVERQIAQQSSLIIEDAFSTTYSSLQTMLSQMQLKIAAAFLQETEYLQQREERLQHEEKIFNERNKQLENIQQERKRIEEDFIQIKQRLESAVVQLTKFKIDGAEVLRTLFNESRQLDEKLSELISESMASLGRSRSMFHSKTKDFMQKSDDIQVELNDRSTLIRNTELDITTMLDLIKILNQLNVEHGQDLSIVKTDFDKKHQDFIDLSQTIKDNWDIKKELEQIRLLENEKKQVQKELLEQTLVLENLKTVLGKATIS